MSLQSQQSFSVSMLNYFPHVFHGLLVCSHELVDLGSLLDQDALVVEAGNNSAMKSLPNSLVRLMVSLLVVVVVFPVSKTPLGAMLQAAVSIWLLPKSRSPTTRIRGSPHTGRVAVTDLVVPRNSPTSSPAFTMCR